MQLDTATAEYIEERIKHAQQAIGAAQIRLHSVLGDQTPVRLAAELENMRIRLREARECAHVAFAQLPR
jgi:hypothetical protein